VLVVLVVLVQVQELILLLVWVVSHQVSWLELGEQVQAQVLEEQVQEEQMLEEQELLVQVQVPVPVPVLVLEVRLVLEELRELNQIHLLL